MYHLLLSPLYVLLRKCREQAEGDELVGYQDTYLMGKAQDLSQRLLTTCN